MEKKAGSKDSEESLISTSVVVLTGTFLETVKDFLQPDFGIDLSVI